MSFINGANPKDPLGKSHSAAPNARELFTRLGRACNGFGHDDVITAAVNLLINSVRQQHKTRASAEREFDEAIGRAKHALLEQHYDLTGKRRNIFPFNQTIEPMHIDFRKRK